MTANPFRQPSTTTKVRQNQPERTISSVSVIIPTYNERGNIIDIIENCREELSEYTHEVLIIDDDSPDKTWKIVRSTYNDENVRVIRRLEETELATAVVRGFQEATNDVCVVIDADHQHPPEKIPALIDALDTGGDVAIGSRYIEGAGVKNWPLFRQCISLAGSWVSKLGLPPIRNLSDPMSGFFAVRRDLVEDRELNPRGYKILLEILVRCNCKEVVEVPYVFSGRENGHSNLTVGECLQFIRHVLTLRFLFQESRNQFRPNVIVQFLRNR